MNSAAIKHLSITEKSGFQGSLATKEEDIVTMLSKIKKIVTPYSDIDKKNDRVLDGIHKYTVPPFVKDTVNGTIANEIGETKTWNKTLWYYCEFPNNHNGMCRHKHKATNCKLRLCHVQSNASPPSANLAHEESPKKEPSADHEGD